MIIPLSFYVQYNFLVHKYQGAVEPAIAGKTAPSALYGWTETLTETSSLSLALPWPYLQDRGRQSLTRTAMTDSVAIGWRRKSANHYGKQV